MVKEKERERDTVREITLPVAGMTCAACVRKAEKALKGLPGVADAPVNLSAALPGVRAVTINPATDTVFVEYLESAVAAAAIKKTVRSLGYDVSEKGEGADAMDRERQLRQAEVHRQLINMLIAWPL